MTLCLKRSNLKKLQVLFRSDERTERGISQRRVLLQAAIVKKELCPMAQLSIYWFVHSPTLTYRHKISNRTEKLRSKIGAAEISFLVVTIQLS